MAAPSSAEGAAPTTRRQLVNDSSWHAKRNSSASYATRPRQLPSVPSVPSGVVTTFSTKGFKGTPYGRARRPASARLWARCGSPAGERVIEREARRRGRGGRGIRPLVGGSLARCLQRGSAPARAAAVTRSAPHPSASGPRRHAPR
jgi:hypothetical protein